jgi:hypothetical protein
VACRRIDHLLPSTETVVDPPPFPRDVGDLPGCLQTVVDLPTPLGRG